MTGVATRPLVAAEAARVGDQAFQYLVEEDGRRVGRVDLTAVRRAHCRCAELGYRIGEHDGGRLNTVARRFVRGRAAKPR